MSRRYDSRTTIFSPQGRLYQVEYAMEAISNAGTVLGVCCRDGIIIAAERKVTSKLLDECLAHEKIYPVTDTILCGVAGITSDANSLIDYARVTAQRYLYAFNHEISGEELVCRVCDLKQSYTQYGGLRPYGVSFLYACHDPHFGFQLYHSDPSGNYAGWKATCIGANNSAATSMLKSEYKDENNDLSLEDAFKLVMRILLKTMDGTSLSEEKLEFGVITRDKSENAGPHAISSKIYSASEVKELITKYAPPPEAKEAENP